MQMDFTSHGIWVSMLHILYNDPEATGKELLLCRHTGLVPERYYSRGMPRNRTGSPTADMTRAFQQIPIDIRQAMHELDKKLYPGKYNSERFETAEERADVESYLSAYFFT
jgi:hypothetical protein